MSAAIDDELWSAIGNPTRRRILDQLLADGASTATALSQHLPVSRQAIAKHIAVLGGAGLVKGYAIGRERRYDVDQEQLARAVAELASVQAIWDARLSRIKRLAEAIERKRNLQMSNATGDRGFTTTCMVDRNPDQLLAAITEVGRWWTGKIDGRAGLVCDELTYQFGDLHDSRQRVTENVLAACGWQFRANPSPARSARTNACPSAPPRFSSVLMQMMFRFCGQGRTAECGTFGFNAYQDKYDSGCEGANPAIALQPRRGKIII